MRVFLLVVFMPRSAPRACRFPGCRDLVSGAGGLCAAHLRDARRESDSRRGSSGERGYGSRWRKARDTYLRGHPLCVECGKSDKVVPATEVDHVVPHKGDQSLFWDTDNWQPLCKSCHSAKTAREDGGFGRGVRYDWHRGGGG
ncbi:HNH endonuclease [Laribacter hongkongensis]|uniref:HNH endonuclease n=1 Tax=Laribacter hongkongensis TaxID=168471 RepID=UPI0027E4DD4D|nr:HNH endonuclease [Laribacter hongkongensis]